MLLRKNMIPTDDRGSVLLDSWSFRLFEVQKIFMKPGMLGEEAFCTKIVAPLVQAILGFKPLSVYTDTCTKISMVTREHQLGWAGLPGRFKDSVVPLLRQAVTTPEYSLFLYATPETVEWAWGQLHGSAGLPDQSTEWTDYRNILYLDRANSKAQEKQDRALSKTLVKQKNEILASMSTNYDKFTNNPFSVLGERQRIGMTAQDLWPFSTGETLVVVKVGNDIIGSPYSTGLVPGDYLTVDRWTVAYESSNVDSEQRRLYLDLKRGNRKLEVDVDNWPVWLYRVDPSEVQDRVERELYDAVYDGSNLKPIQDKATGKALTRQAAREKRATQVDAMNQKLYDQVKDFSEEEMISFRSVLDLSARLAEEFNIVTEDEMEAIVDFLQTRRDNLQKVASKGKPKIRILEPEFVVDPEPEDFGD